MGRPATVLRARAGAETQEAALQEEVSMPLEGGEGPVGLVLCPSRELARQTHDIIAEFADVLRKKGGYPEIRSLLAIGGMDMKEEMETVRSRGCTLWWPLRAD